jgi:DNA-binding transcriptional LysR family regulator
MILSSRSARPTSIASAYRSRISFTRIESRLLRYVVAVAEQQSFSKAADCLHTSQPSLSRQIKELEATLRVELFHRTTRTVRLTQAGELFVREARQCLMHNQRATHVVRPTPVPAQLTLGCSPYVDPSLIETIRSVVSTRFSETRLAVTSVFTLEQLTMLANGHVDAALVIMPAKAHNVLVESIQRDPLLAALPDGHPLSHLPTIPLSALNDVPLISFPRRLHPEFYGQLRLICQREGLNPHVAHEVTTFTEALALVRHRQGVAFIRDFYRDFARFRVTVRSLQGQPLWVETGIAYSPMKHSPLLAECIAALQERYGRHMKVAPRSAKKVA